MNWRLAFTISLLGLLMAVITVYFTSPAIELIVWLIVLVASAYLVAKYADDDYFVHGLFTGILIGVWIAVADTLLFGKYYITHRQEANLISNLGVTSSVHSTLFILSPAAGLFAGSLIGLLALAIAKAIKPKPAL